MKEYIITILLDKLIDKNAKYIPSIEGGYYFEIFFASNRICSKPFKVNNSNNDNINKMFF